ncbi:MAG: hypothetical protein ACT7A5_16655 [Ferrovibrionaceae bacterium]
MTVRLLALAGIGAVIWTGAAAAAAGEDADTLIDLLDHFGAVAIARIAAHPELFGDQPPGVFSLHRDRTTGPLDGILGPEGRRLLSGADICLYFRNRPDHRFDALVFTAGPGRLAPDLLTRAVERSSLRGALIDGDGNVTPPHPLWHVDLGEVTVPGCLPTPGHLALHFGAQRYAATQSYSGLSVAPRNPSGGR